MASRGIPVALSARSRKGFTLFWAALFVLSILLQYASAIAPRSVLAATAGYNAPGATTTPNEWSNPGNALASDNVYATSTADNDDQGYRNFGFSIPAGSIIDGIEVQVDAKETTSSGSSQVQVRLSGDGGSSWTLYDDSVTLTTTEQTDTLGGTAVDWNRDWDPTQLTDANFRLEVRNNGSADISLDQVRVRVTYRTMTSGTANGTLTSAVCQAADFSFVVDMSGSIGQQGSLPSNLPDLKSGITGFVNAFQGAGGDGRYAGTRFNNGGTSNLTGGFVSASTFNTAINALSSPTGDTPTGAGITAGRGNSANDRSGVPNIMFVVTDGSPNNPGGTSNPSGWLTGANAAIGAANTTRSTGTPGGGNWIVKAVYLSTPTDPGDTGLPFSPAGDAQWASSVMTQIGGGSYLAANFSSFAGDLLRSIGCSPGLTVDKGVSLTNGSGYGPSVTTTAGTTVYYRIRISNTGNVPLTGVTLSDSLFNLASECASSIPTSLAVGASYNCDYSDTAVVGTTTNTATADSDQTPEVTDSATVTVEALPGLTVDKGVSLTNGSGYGPSVTTTAGTTVYYRIRISNTGNVPLTGVTLSDSLFNLASECASSIPTSLAVGASYNCDYSDTAVVGTTTNTATADSDQTSSVNDSTTVTVEATSRLVVEKTFGDSQHSGPASPGDTVYYRISIDNTGNSAATGVDVIDDINDLLVYGSTYNPPANPPTTSYAAGVLRWDDLTVPTSGLELSFSITLGSGFPVGLTELPNTVVVVGPGSNCAPLDLALVATDLQDPCSTDTHVTVRPTPGSITIVKQTIPDGSNEVFTFVFDEEEQFQLSDGQSKTFSELKPGFYTIDEINLPADWELTSVTGEGCNADGQGTVSLEDGDAVVCVFTNTGPPPPPPPGGWFQITKTVAGDLTGWTGGDFLFTVTCGGVAQTGARITIPAAGGSNTSQSYGPFEPGTTCTVTESSQPPAGENASWADPAYSPSATIAVASGQTAGVTVTNTRIVRPPESPTASQDVLAETGRPRVTLPPTSTLGGESSGPGASLGLILLILAGTSAVLAIITPKPSRIRRRDRRD